MIPPFHWWRTVFWLIPAISVYTVVVGTVSLVSCLVDPRGRLAHGCARVWSWLILATTGVRVRVTGRNRLVRDHSYVFVANHQSIYDIPILFASLPFQLRIIAKASLAYIPMLGWHLRQAGHLLVDREKPGTATLTRMAQIMRRGHSLMVFPEGTRSVDGQLRRFKRGVFLGAIDAGLPIVPVVMIGSRHVMLKGRLMTCPGEVQLVIHDPLPTRDLNQSAARALAERTRDIIATTVMEHDRLVGDESPGGHEHLASTRR